MITDLAPALYELAANWPTYTDVTPAPRTAVFIDRCAVCHEEVFPVTEDIDDVVRHMLTSHGYRMDGRQFDNRNREIGHA